MEVLHSCNCKVVNYTFLHTFTEGYFYSSHRGLGKVHTCITCDTVSMPPQTRDWGLGGPTEALWQKRFPAFSEKRRKVSLAHPLDIDDGEDPGTRS